MDAAAHRRYTTVTSDLRTAPMTVRKHETTATAVQRLLEKHGLSADSRLYREAMRDALKPTGAPGVFTLAANAAPSESVVDVYGEGYLVQAEHVGPGLAFAEAAASDWQETMEMRAIKSRSAIPLEDRVGVEVRLADILGQGGLVYPVESVTVERVWYCTLPSGSVTVRIA